MNMKNNNFKLLDIGVPGEIFRGTLVADYNGLDKSFDVDSIEAREEVYLLADLLNSAKTKLEVSKGVSDITFAATWCKRQLRGVKYVEHLVPAIQIKVMYNCSSAEETKRFIVNVLPIEFVDGRICIMMSCLEKSKLTRTGAQSLARVIANEFDKQVYIQKSKSILYRVFPVPNDLHVCV